MDPKVALAEDLRRVGVAAIIAGIVGSFLQGQVDPGIGFVAILGGGLGLLSGYYVHHRANDAEAPS
jgi:uncharacterized membrane protein YfcA